MASVCVCVLAESDTARFPVEAVPAVTRENLLLWKWILPIPTFTDKEEALARL